MAKAKQKAKSKPQPKLTIAVARKVLEVVDAGLTSGMGNPVPGQMCVEAAVCYAMGMPHGDNPKCVAQAVRRFKIRLNDARWSSDKARAKGLRQLAIAQLGSDQIDQRLFADLVVVGVINRILPLSLRAIAKRKPESAEALEKSAKDCESVSDRVEGRVVVRAARDLIYKLTGMYAYAAYADAAAADAAYAAYADAAAADAAYAAYADAAAADAAYAAAAAYADAADAADAYAAAYAADAYAAAYAAAAYADAYAAAAAYADAADAADAYAAADAAAAAYAYADAAAAAYAYAAAAAADAAYADSILSLVATIAVDALKKCKSQGVKWLKLSA